MIFFMNHKGTEDTEKEIQRIKEKTEEKRQEREVSRVTEKEYQPKMLRIKK